MVSGLPEEKGGILLQIELGPHRPSRDEVKAKIGDLARRLMPGAVLVGYQFREDRVEVAFVSAERYRAAERQGPRALRQLAPWVALGEEFEGPDLVATASAC